MNICLLIIGSISLIIATLLITVPISFFNNQIDDLNQQVTILRNKRDQFTSILIKQGQSSVLEELYAFQANDMLYREETDKANDFIKMVLNESAKSAGQWASASMVDDVANFEKETYDEANKIVSDTGIDFVKKRHLLSQLYNTNQDIALHGFSELQKQLSETNKQIEVINKRKKKYYTVFVCLQVLGLICLALGDVLEKSTKST